MKIFLNKKFVVLLSILLIFFYFSLSSFVNASTYKVDNIEYNVPDIPDNIKNSNYIIYCKKDSDIINYYIYSTSSDNFDRFVIHHPYEYIDSEYSELSYSSKDNDFPNYCRQHDQYYVKEDNSWSDSYYDADFPSIDNCIVIYSTSQIYNPDGSVFFPETSSILAHQMKEIKMSQVLQEVLGLIPLAIGLLVSVIGLRKALQVLSNRLRAC